MSDKPAISFAVMPGRRKATIELARDLERRGFEGLYCASFGGDTMAVSAALAVATSSIWLGTSIVNIYLRHPHEYAKGACLVHELSGGRFRFGIGVSHAPVNASYGVKTGTPTADVRRFVEELPKGAEGQGELPPIVLATLRRPMVRLASEIAGGAVWANAARSSFARSLEDLTPEQRTGNAFFVGNMIPTCIADDRAAAAATLRKTLRTYVQLPNYQRYWSEAGYEQEMNEVRAALEARDKDRAAAAMSDRWLRDVTLFGSAAEVREGVEAWRAAGLKTPILVPSATSGGQMKALEELVAAFD
jgi:alkanesulfonate monooxygenase SsuD/methylene tetrahydromethanopterin reductase-like flavin-dependent oxidoreductase (luciferase family)